MIKEFTLTFIFIILSINNIYAYDINNKCESYLNEGNLKMAAEAAKNVKNEYDANFCLGKVNYSNKNYSKAADSFKKSERVATHPADQMQAILFKGISERENKKYKDSSSTFKYGFETAKLGNTKYLQYEHRFSYQIGKNYLITKDFFESIDEFTKALRTASNDEERAVSYDGIAQANYLSNKSAKAVEFGLRASLLYQKSGMLEEYADSTIELSRYYYLDKKSQKAIDLLTKLEKFCIDNGGEYFLAKTLLAKSALYEKMGDSKLSKDFQSKADIVIKRIGANDLIQ